MFRIYFAALNENAETLISRTTGVDVNTATKQTLYTVPTGKILIVTRVVFRNASTSLTTASFGVGFDASGIDVLASETHTELTGSTLVNLRTPFDGAKRGAAGDVLGLKCSINQGGAATITVEVFGFLIPA